MKRILVAPLNWGLGHATRCIPIIKYLLNNNCEVIIATNGRSLELLKQEFPSCRFAQLNGYNISYPQNGSMILKMASQIPNIIIGIKKEHEQLKRLIKNEKIDAVISDNRFGLWSNHVPCVFIIHQIMIKSPFGEKIIHHLNKKYILKYNECWVPDTVSYNLSGELAHKFPLPSNAKFIGILSRFTIPDSLPPIKRKLLILLSGPEPQRCIFENKILKQLTSADKKINTLIVQGITEKKERKKISENVEMVSYLCSNELQHEILSSEIILSRSGYSTIMDMAALNKKKVVLVPTPGQTEQEHLAQHLSQKGIAYSVSQKAFNLITCIDESEKYHGFIEKYSTDRFKSAIDSFLVKI